MFLLNQNQMKNLKMKPYTFLIICSLNFTGCMVGPNYAPPKDVLPDHFIEDVLAKTELVEDEDFVNWWCRFNDPLLNDLLETALSQNYDYRIAFERIFQARAQYWVQFTQILPELDASITASRFRASRSFRNMNTIDPLAPNLSPIDNFYQMGLAAIWEIDLWGKFRRGASASYGIWQATAFDFQGVKIVVISDVASTYATIRALQKRLSTAEEVFKLDQNLSDLSKSRVDAGIANIQEYESIRAIYERDASILALAESSLKQAIYSLSTLTGILPEEIIEYFADERPIPNASGLVPIALPSDLLRRRPDIRSAERQLAAATEDIGIVMADLLPTLSLTGSSGSFASNPLQGANVGVASNRLNKLFKPESLIWGIGGFVTLPVLDFGKREAVVDQQVAIRNQSYFAYKKTVMGAIQETEQSLTAYFNQEKSLESLMRQEATNNRLLSLITDLFQAGLSDYIEVLRAREVWLQSVNGVTDAKRALMIDLITVYKALGGNW